MASADGYGSSAEELIRSAVHDHGADIGLIVHDWRDDRFCGPEIRALEVPRGQVAARDLLVVYFMPYGFAQFRSRVTVGQTMFETTRIPDTWAALCDRTAGVIVPSEFCRRVFERQVGVPVRTVPLGVNVDTYSFVDRSRRLADGEPVRFLMCGLLHYRKGVQFALDAFRQEFHASEPVELVLKTRRGFLDPPVLPDDPRIRVIDADFTREQLRDLYGSADCLVACSRGEGAGLTPLEAMATGLTCIVTDWGGLADIANATYNMPLQVDALEAAPPECSSYGPGVTRGEPIGDFARPSVPHLRRLMRSVYEDRALTHATGRLAAGWVRREWSASVSSRRWLDAIYGLYGEASKPPEVWDWPGAAR